jgi:hypothetical protein
MALLIIAAVLLVVFRVLSRTAGNLAGVEPVGWSPNTNWRVVAPLARSDLRLLVRHPAFVAGVILTPLMLFAATESETDWRSVSADIALALVPLGWLTIVATNLIVLRPRRTGTDELFAALPAPQPVRTSAMLATAIGPVIVAAILALAWVLVAGIHDDLRGSPRWGEIAAGLLIVAGSVCVGVAVARWLPNAGFGVLAAIATIVIQARFLDVTTWPWDRNEGDQLRFLGFLAEPTSVTDEFLEARPSGWHLVYLGGLVTVMAGIALARDGMRRPVAVVLSAGVLVAAGAGWMQTRPLSATQVDAMVSYLIEPGAHQICEDSNAARFCAYPSFAGGLPDWQDRVQATLAMLPAVALDGRPPLEVIQRPAIIVSNEDCSPTAFEDGLPPGVAARLSAAELWPADGHVHPPFDDESFPCSERATGGFFLAVQTGAWAVGLPAAPHDRNERCTANGQARAAIALWSGATASPDGARTLRDVTTDGSTGGEPMITFADWDDPPMWGVDYTVADAEIALAMLDLPAADVRAALARDWTHWTDPHTPSAALAAEFGIDGGAAESSPATNATCL